MSRSPLRFQRYRIDPFDLKLFALVADAGSITAAAQAAHLSLAAASARLQRLEHAVGAQLLARSKRGAAPTDAGRALMRHGARLLRELDALHAEMTPYARGLRGTVRVLCNTAAMTEHLPPLLAGFLRDHPEIDVDLRELASDDVLEAMRRELADIGVIADYVDASGLSTWPFADDRLVVVEPAGKRRGRDAPQRFADLLDRAFVGLPGESGLSRFLQARAAQAGGALHHRVRVRSFDAVAQLVAEGIGIAIIPERAVQRLAPLPILARPLADAWAQRRLLLCTLPQAPSRGAAALLAHLRAGS